MISVDYPENFAVALTKKKLAIFPIKLDSIKLKIYRHDGERRKKRKFSNQWTRVCRSWVWTKGKKSEIVANFFILSLVPVAWRWWTVPFWFHTHSTITSTTVTMISIPKESGKIEWLSDCLLFFPSHSSFWAWIFVLIIFGIFGEFLFFVEILCKKRISIFLKKP